MYFLNNVLKTNILRSSFRNYAQFTLSFVYIITFLRSELLGNCLLNLYKNLIDDTLNHALDISAKKKIFLSNSEKYNILI